MNGLGCGPDWRPLIRASWPLNGQTFCPATQPIAVLFAEDSSFTEASSWVNLQVMENGQTKPVDGGLLLAGQQLEFKPTKGLITGRQYELVIARELISGEKIDDQDASESPAELITAWPYHLRFSTYSAPQLRAAYLESEGDAPSILLRFSEPMDVVSTSSAIAVLSPSGSLMSHEDLLWLDTQNARLTLKEKLIPTQIYSLRLSKEATATTGITFDGNGNGTPGENDDQLLLRFTGIQKVIRSRLPAHN